MRRLALITVFVALVTLLVPAAAHAWKPYTHNKTGDDVWADATADGKITMNGREYPLRPELVAALVPANKPFYNAGVVGPDGFPDIVFGQAVIHSEDTGAWVRHIINQAWAAQTNPIYTAAERKQILAFSYGFATHAAGDMWAHTFVNDFADGVFPGVKEVVTNIDKFEIALRHNIVEGYAGYATIGYDDNADRTLVAGEVNEDGDPEVSDDSTPAVPFAAPHRFIYETFVNPNNPLPFGTCGNGDDDDHDGVDDDGCPGGPPPLDVCSDGVDNDGDGTADDGCGFPPSAVVGDGPESNGPEPQRGPLLDFFISTQADLEVLEREFQMESNHGDCLFGLPGSDCNPQVVTQTVNTVRGQMTASANLSICELEPGETGTPSCVGNPADTDIIDNLIESYLEAWIDDIKTGLPHWSELGLAFTTGMFDPRGYREAQDWICRNEGSESSVNRVDCEDHVGTIDVLLFHMEDFILDHALPMLGLPDDASTLISAVSSISDFFSDIFGPALNPIEGTIIQLKTFFKDKLKEAIENEFKVDIDQLRSFLVHPTHWLDQQSASLTLPFLGTVTVDLFQTTAPSDHSRIDALLGLPANHHAVGRVKLPDGSFVMDSSLADGVVFDTNTFAAYADTVDQGKLLLLDGVQLNKVVKDELVAQGVMQASAAVTTYPNDAGGTPTNIMYHPLTGSHPWLRSIDSDHAWRADGKPRFCTEGTPGCTGSGPPEPRPARLNAGTGQYPLWESCLARPVFRAIYTDWENATQQFPELGDKPSADPTDPNAPETTLTPTGGVFTSGGTTYLGGSHTLTLSATEAVFAPAHVKLRYRVYKDGTSAGAFQPIANGGTFSIPSAGGDGVYHVEFQSEDPCHTFATDDSLEPETLQTKSFTLDTTPPTITIASPPNGSVFDIPDTTTIQFSATDGPGSGVGSTSVTFDGASAANGQLLDMFFLEAGVHTIVVNAADNLGNAASLTRTFVLSPTIQGLRFAVNRAIGVGWIEPLLKSWLDTSLQSAQQAHNLGLHSAEIVNLRAFVEKVGSGVRAGKINAVFGGRAQRWTQYLIANHP